MKKILLLLGFALLACSEKEGTTDIIKIKYGTSFGECIGYCYNEITVDPESVAYTTSGWADTIKTINCSENINMQNWLAIKFKINTVAFFALPATIGCPDCADGGAEWIELELANRSRHKVTFEYFNEPAITGNYIEDLREFMKTAKKCNK